ncbi:MAG: MFS transporter [Bdellovibrio sp. 28-41-41]|nr:MAG: MFS transporter [Bdellovibrio sp. 28-41-41]
MAAASVLLTLLAVIILYFKYNPMAHASPFMVRRFLNWFPLGMSYAFLYMARYNINVASNALGSKMSIASFGTIFAAGTITYGFSFLLNGPLVDKWGSKKGMLLATGGSSIANVAMGIVVYLFLNGQLDMNMTVALSILYSINMFFQSYGAVSIIKNKAYWFHVRERGIFGAIFGTLISVGIYFAFDLNSKIADSASANPKNPGFLSNLFHTTLGSVNNGVDSVWFVFFIPALLLLFWFIMDAILVKDMPSQAGHHDFDTADASSGLMHIELTKTEMLKKVFSNPIIMMVAAIEFTTGVIRNGVMQWYFKFGKVVPQVGAEFFHDNWGLILCLTGIAGGFAAGHISDKVFQSRRGPPVVIAGTLITIIASTMYFNLLTSPLIVGTCAVLLGLLSISVHSLMSGTAAADFGGRKMTATASGITDGFVYLGTGLQSLVLGNLLTEKPESWHAWPAFLVPFGMMSVFIALKMWKSLPEATRKYLAENKTPADRVRVVKEARAGGTVNLEPDNSKT